MRRVFSRRRRYEELAESMREHLAEKVEELVESGMARRTRSLRRSGSLGT